MADAPKKPPLTTAAGIPLSDNQNALTAGPRGPLAPRPRLAALREARALQPRAHRRARSAREGLGRLRHLYRHRRHHALHQSRIFSAVGKQTPLVVRFCRVARRVMRSVDVK